jgi:tetratricopeptide (TPR) repeat protein
MHGLPGPHESDAPLNVDFSSLLTYQVEIIEEQIEEAQDDLLLQAELYHSRAKLYAQYGCYEEALRDLEEALRRFSHSPHNELREATLEYLQSVGNSWTEKLQPKAGE